jgi:hypothetical protein
MKRYLNISLSCAAAGVIATAALSAQGQTTKPAPPASGTMKPSEQAKSTPMTANLGSVRIPRAVTADGKPLAAGTYQIRVTQTEAQPAAPGQTPQYERWAEFLQGGQVRGREVVTIVPGSDMSQVAEARPPASGSQRIELLKGGDYLRIWLNRGGTHYLIHFNVS